MGVSVVCVARVVRAAWMRPPYVPFAREVGRDTHVVRREVVTGSAAAPAAASEPTEKPAVPVVVEVMGRMEEAPVVKLAREGRGGAGMIAPWAPPGRKPNQRRR